MDVSSSVAEECVDCWIVPGFSFPDMLKPISDLERNDSAVKAKKKKLRIIYNNLIDGLVDKIEAMPPALKLHTFTKDTMYFLEQISSTEEVME